MYIKILVYFFLFFKFTTLSLAQIKFDRGTCRGFQVQCASSNQCIDQEKVCDGKKDCSDETDETAETCKNQACPGYAFKCDYGACIEKKLLCNNKFDCVDGSDEKKEICNVTITIVNRDNENTVDTCYVPLYGVLELIERNSNLTLRPGSVADDDADIVYKCPKGYYLDGSKTNICIDERWTSDVPKCKKYCKPIEGITIKPHCTLDGVAVPCDQNVEPRTVAKVDCALNYKRPENSINVDEAICDSNGDWNLTPSKCEPRCAEVNLKTPFSVGGQETPIEKVPWTAAIYQNFNNINETGYSQICGGTIIHSKIIVTAAHCFWDRQNKKDVDSSLFRVAVGKYLRSFESEENQKQVFKIAQLNRPFGFNGDRYDYLHDIAVLTLEKHIIFENHILPACLQFKEFLDKDIGDRVKGIVSGWGQTENGTPSEVLKSVNMETANRDICKKKISVNDNIANDKFCVNLSKGQNVCPGDSGGGYMVIGKDNRYYLWGVVSHGITKNRSEKFVCNQEFVTTFTNVQYYKDLIQNVQVRVAGNEL